MTPRRPHVAVIGAGVGGLAAGLRLAHSGAKVSVFESASTPGGKMRALPTKAGPVDAGPTVLTMRPVFEALFAETGSALENHLTLEKERILARHFWTDGTTFDLTRDRQENQSNIADVFGQTAAREYADFEDRTQMLFEAFDAPVMKAARPSLATLMAQVLRNPKLLRAMRPHQTLLAALRSHFSDQRLVQLFARYATYVGGRPDASPALLSLIWQAEAQGVWHVKGGMHALARAIEDRAKALGAAFYYNSPVSRIEVQDGAACAVHTQHGRTTVDAVLFNGDPRALAEGVLGNAVLQAVTQRAHSPRSLSANVHTFAAKAVGAPLAAHNVFFGKTPEGEFTPLGHGTMPKDPTLYICAQDRFGGQVPTGPERFEIIMNAPPTHGTTPKAKDIEQCQTLVMNRLAHFGLRFDPQPGPETLTMPEDFAKMFPASNGSLYGRSPHGMMAAFQRPTVRSKVPGLYLVGGGVHPGAGVPMATLCARHAAEAMRMDLGLTSASAQAAMHGGISTESVTMGPVPSRSSGS